MSCMCLQLTLATLPLAVVIMYRILLTLPREYLNIHEKTSFSLSDSHGYHPTIHSPVSDVIDGRPLCHIEKSQGKI